MLKEYPVSVDIHQSRPSFDTVVEKMAAVDAPFAALDAALTGSVHTALADSRRVVQACGWLPLGERRNGCGGRAFEMAGSLT